MNSKVRVALGLVLAMVWACGSDSAGGDDDSEGGGSFAVFPTRVFSGSDGTNEYKAPVHAQNTTKNVEWSIDKADIASLEPSGTNNQDLMIITKKAGTATITAKHGDDTKLISLKVNAYTVAQWEAGKARYMTNKDADNPACVTCHGEGKPTNHSPSEVDRDEDEDLIQIITTGVDPEDNPEEPARIADRREFEQLLNGKTHAWSVTEAEKIGLVAYIRTLEPRGRPALDD